MKIDEVKEEADALEISPPNMRDDTSTIKSRIVNLQLSNDADLLIERNVHYCTMESIDYFKKLLRKDDIELLACPHLNFSITDEKQSKQCIASFIDTLFKIKKENEDI